MTITLVTSSGLVSGTAHTYAAAGDELYVAQGVTWGSSNGSIFSNSSNSVTATFAGDVIANIDGVHFSGTDSSLRIMATGSFTSYETHAGSFAVHLNGERGSLYNDGDINAVQAIGVLVKGVDSTVINHGSIEAASGVFTGLLGASNTTVINSGHITANAYDDASQNERYNNGIMSEGANTVITNLAGGVITATGSTGAGVRLYGSADGSSVENHGEIVSVNDWGVNFAALNGGQGSLFNAGVIAGKDGSFIGGRDTDDVTNRGTMIGDVDLGAGDDTFDGRGGTVEGAVKGGTGNDTYLVDDAQLTLVEQPGEGYDTVKSSVNWRLGDTFEALTLIGDGNIRGIGNGENNTLFGNIGDNRLRGKDGTDNINAGDGDDKVWGGAGSDFLFGDDGEDVLHGGQNNDKMYGNDGSDVLYGNRGNDTLSGGDGDDRLIGGLGRDRLSGGAGEDEFVFNRLNDSINSGKADKIMDFVVGEDVIDLRGLAGSHSYIGTGAFSGAAGEVQAIVSGGNTQVKVDVDGDGSADMKIMVVGTIDLTAGEFLL